MKCKILLLGIILLVSSASATETPCDSCSDCNVKLNDGYDVVKLTADITNHTGTCIAFGASNLEFDCQGHSIDGDDSGDDYGIYMNGGSGNTVSNCVVTDFSYGIRLYDCDNTALTGNTANSNILKGISLYSSNDNTLTDNTANNNSDKGIFLLNSNYSTLTGNTANSNDYDGIYLHSSSHCTLTGNTANSNEDYGIYLYSSSNSTLNSNQFCYNNWDFVLVSGSSGNSGDMNVCDTTYDWSDEGATGCTYSCGETTTSTTSTTTTTSTSTTTTSTTTSTSTTTTIAGDCSLVGDTPPCDEITLSEVIDLITLWADEQANLSDVIDLINAWALD